MRKNAHIPSSGPVTTMYATNTPVSLSLPVVSVDRLLDTTGSPLATPHLHPEAADALLKLAERSQRGVAMQLEFVVPAQDKHRTDEVRHALVTHFQQSETELSHRLKSILRQGRVAARGAAAVRTLACAPAAPASPAAGAGTYHAARTLEPFNAIFEDRVKRPWNFRRKDGQPRNVVLEWLLCDKWHGLVRLLHTQHHPNERVCY